MRSLAVMNQKGGSGKTTTAVNLAAALAEKKKTVLVIDLDPQASCTRWLGVHDAGRGLLDVFAENGSLGSIIRPTSVSGVDLVPSSSWLLGIDKALSKEVGAETILSNAISKLPADRWDFLLIDCPPSLGILSVAALTASGEVLVPVETSVMALAGLADLTQTIERVQQRLNKQLALTAILACRVDLRKNLSKEVIKRLRSRFGASVLKTVIRENVRLMEAPSFEKPINYYAPTSTGADDYRAAAAEILKMKRRN